MTQSDSPSSAFRARWRVMDECAPSSVAISYRSGGNEFLIVIQGADRREITQVVNPQAPGRRGWG